MDGENLSGIRALGWLETAGFHFTLEDGQISFVRCADWPLDQETARTYLAAIKADKAGVVVFLRDRQDAHCKWLEAYEAWRNDPNPANNSQHKQQIARAAVSAGLPFYEDGENDSGPEGWNRWADGLWGIDAE